MNTKSEFYQRVKKQEERYNKPILYRYLNPLEQEIVKNVFKEYYIFESSIDAEYKRLYVTDLNEELDFQISYYKSTYMDKEISHRDVLGALMNLGINRDVFGDILITDSQVYIECIKEQSTYIKDNLHQIKRDFIFFEETTKPDESIVEKKEELTISVDSIRLDAIISKVFGIKRDDVKKMIEQGYVKVNYFITEKIMHKLNPCDIISIRGYGRIIYIDTEGLSKKQKTRVKLHILR